MSNKRISKNLKLKSSSKLEIALQYCLSRSQIRHDDPQPLCLVSRKYESKR